MAQGRGKKIRTLGSMAGGTRIDLRMHILAGKFWPDISKINKSLGWEPKVVLRDGLAHMVKDFKRRLQVE
eukprot:scaffold53669_cov17-Tisochrysis_lutea.AAC.2